MECSQPTCHTSTSNHIDARDFEEGEKGTYPKETKYQLNFLEEENKIVRPYMKINPSAGRTTEWVRCSTNTYLPGPVVRPTVSNHINKNNHNPNKLEKEKQEKEKLKKEKREKEKLEKETGGGEIERKNTKKKENLEEEMMKLEVGARAKEESRHVD